MAWRRTALAPLLVLALPLLLALPAPVRGADLLSNLKHWKPPKRLVAGARAVGDALTKKNGGSAVQALEQKVVKLRPSDLAKVTHDIEEAVRDVDVKGTAEQVLEAADPELAKTLQSPAAHRVAEALQKVDAKDVEAMLYAMSVLAYWSNHWQQPCVLLLVSCLLPVLSWRLLRGRLCRKRGARQYIADECLLPAPEEGDGAPEEVGCGKGCDG